MQRQTRLVISSITGDYVPGGWQAQGTVYGDTDLLVFGDFIDLRGLSFAGFDDLIERRLMVGHVLETPDFTFDPFSSQAPIRIGTANYLLAGIDIQDIGYTEQGSPANNHQIAATMRLSSCFAEAMSNHCNFIYDATGCPDGIIFDTDYASDDTALSRFNLHKSDNMWSALTNQLGGGEEGGVQLFRPFVTRNNVMVYQPPPHFRTVPPTSKGTITKAHMRTAAPPRVQVRNAKTEDRVGQVQIIAAGGTAGTYYEAVYPTNRGDGKIIRKTSGIWADSQGRADTLAQNLYQWLTRPYTLQIEVDPGLLFFGDDGDGLELGDRLDITYDGPTESTATGHGVHVDFDAQAFYLYRAEVRYDAREKQARCTLTLEADN